ncbi:hypothetical protein [Edaphobacter sp. 12200R-103]|jgi:hypothetical protein|uniref:hypothetical protein n=1 Tax=Edaphobacter sp. 12200R-103 TaxID=2703788 RepID=UPI001EE3DA90|nr:hypothetical protein [Edaphobacter sp. 12200R-103]
MKVPFFATAALVATFLPISLVAQQKEPGRCTITPGQYLGWQAERVSNRWVTLTFVPQLGGRLMQVEFNGHAYLFTNPRFRGKYISPDEAKGGWINYGGDKIWPMPEGSEDENHWVIQSTAIDDLPYSFETLSKGKECMVRLTGQPDTITGMRIVRTVTLGAESPEIHFHALMENATAHPITWSIQSVSQYDLSDPAKPGDFNHNFWAYTPRNPASSFPDGMHVRYGLAHDPSFSFDGDLFRLHWTWFGNEVWLDSNAGWVAIVDKSSRYGMVETFHVKRDAEYPGKTSVIFYQNGPTVSFDEKGIPSIAGADSSKDAYYMEAEINSPMVTLQPGETYAFDTAWHPISIDAQPEEFSAPGLVVERLKATVDAGKLHLKGNFSVFAPGKLMAVFFNRNGIISGQHELEDVDPAKMVMLDTTVPIDPGLARVSLKLIDSEGKDRGSLSIAKVEAR